jgi:HSP20 family protein
MKTLEKRKMNQPTNLNDVFLGNNWIDNFFSNAIPQVNHFSPDADIIEKENEFLISIALPGLTKKDIKIDLMDHKLSISGETKKDETKEGDKYVSREIVQGSFHREFKLSNHIDTKKIEATFADGLLHISLPKSEKASPKSINIK